MFINIEVFLTFSSKQYETSFIYEHNTVDNTNLATNYSEGGNIWR